MICKLRQLLFKDLQQGEEAGKRTTEGAGKEVIWATLLTSEQARGQGWVSGKLQNSTASPTEGEHSVCVSSPHPPTPITVWLKHNPRSSLSLAGQTDWAALPAWRGRNQPISSP